MALVDGLEELKFYLKQIFLENHEYLCFKTFVDLIMIRNCLRNIKYDEQRSKIYFYVIYSYSTIS